MTIELTRIFVEFGTSGADAKVWIGDGLFKKLSLEQQSAALAFDGNPDFGPPMTDLTKALSELRRLKLGDEIDAEFVSTILDAARTGDLLPRADADLAVALMVEKAARLIISFPGGTVMHSPPQLLTEAHDAVMGLVSASALADLQALRDDVTGWISNAQVAREKWSEYEARAEAAEAELVTLRAQVERLTDLIQWAHDTLWELNPGNYGHDDVCKVNDASVEVILGLAPIIGETHGHSVEWWEARAALTEGAAP